MLKKIIWFTGLSGSGKSTLSKLLNKKLLKSDYKTKIVDGDLFRRRKKNLKSFTKKNIFKNNLSIIKYISKFQKNYDYIIVSVISPLSKTRYKAKKIFGDNYFEIYVHCSKKELLRRDPKGLYALAKKNILKNLIGFNSKIVYEKSNYKKIIINTEKNNLQSCIKKILEKIY
mgnify:CR=1 FL=1|tara:strand:- start:200 stop:715 length:516 start_codon:yes stop_codon:yes gene_type:complete